MKSTFSDDNFLELKKTLENEKGDFIERKKEKQLERRSAYKLRREICFLYFDMDYSAREIEIKLYKSGVRIPADLISTTAWSTFIINLVATVFSTVFISIAIANLFLYKDHIFSAALLFFGISLAFTAYSNRKLKLR